MINKSDQDFFKLLEKDRKKHAKPEISLEDFRAAPKRLVEYIENPSDINYQDIYLQVSDSDKIKLRYYHADNSIKPLIIYFPGNAFIQDLFEENNSIISKIALHSGCHAVMVDYRHAPEYKYPTQINDSLNAIKYIISNKDLKFDKNKIILCGYSSGANLAAICTNKLRHSNDLAVFHQFLISGAFDYTNSLHDYDEYALKDGLLDPSAAQFSFDCYGKYDDFKNPDCSPYWDKDLSGLPPTTIIVGEYDGGRSQSEAYYEKLLSFGNHVEKIVMPGQTHGTIMYRKICSDGQDPSMVAANKIKEITS